jgi:lipopolysaccharide transport system permease protein
LDAAKPLQSAGEPVTLQPVGHEPTYVIQPLRGWKSLGLREVWQSRELFYFLVWRDIKVRYKQTVLGALWAVLQPFLAMVIFSLFFGKLAHVPSDGIPYPIFSYAGLVPWTFFANGLGDATASMVNGAPLVSKVYFPRLIIPVAAVLGYGVDFLIAFAVLLGMMVYYRISPTGGLIWAPVSVALIVATALGTGLWLSGLNVYFRDVRYVQPFLTQFWLFATPVAYPSSLVKGVWHTIYGLNPMAGAIETFRWGLLGTGQPPGPMLVVSAATSLVILVSGAFVFRRLERSFADVV